MVSIPLGLGTVSAFPKNLPRKGVVHVGGRQEEEGEGSLRGRRKGRGEGERGRKEGQD